jgi:AraC-like DNA-binding protein
MSFRAAPLLHRLPAGPSLRNESVDVIKEATWQTLPTVTGFAARRAIAALRKRKLPLTPLLLRASLSESNFANRQHRISATAQGKFLEYAAEAVDDSAFGLHLAEEANPHEAGLLYFVASAANDLGEALTFFERYFRIVNEAVHLKLARAPKGAVVEVSFHGLSRHSIRQNAEFGIAVILKALREVSGRKLRPTRVTFVHARNSNLREFERFFGCPVEFAAPSDRISFSRETLALPLVTGDQYLLETLQPFCDGAARERCTASGSLRALIENEVQSLLSQGKTQKQNVANSLGLSARTLSRRLAEEGTTYEEVVDQLRRSLALQYIKDPSISLGEMTWLLGYEGSTSFNHAFRRWTGHSPSAARQQT